MYVKDESLGWVIRPGYRRRKASSHSATRIRKGRKNKIPAGEMIGPDELFFAEGADERTASNFSAPKSARR